MVFSFVVSLTAYVAGGVLKKHTLRRYGSGPARHQLFNALTSLAAVIFLLLMGLPKELSGFTVGLGVVFGLVVAGQNLASLQALELGPLSYTTVICSLSSLIPTLSGALLWDETISLVQYGGIAALVICFVLSAAGEGFLLIAMSVSALASGAVLGVLALQKKAEREVKDYFGWLPLLIMLVFGLCVALNNKLNLYLAGVMDSAVFYPVMNGGTLMGTTLCACLIFRERLTRRQWIGLAVGILAVILLCDPFG